MRLCFLSRPRQAVSFPIPHPLAGLKFQYATNVCSPMSLVCQHATSLGQAQGLRNILNALGLWMPSNGSHPGCSRVPLFPDLHPQRMYLALRELWCLIAVYPFVPDNSQPADCRLGCALSVASCRASFQTSFVQDVVSNARLDVLSCPPISGSPQLLDVSTTWRGALWLADAHSALQFQCSSSSGTNVLHYFILSTEVFLLSTRCRP